MKTKTIYRCTNCGYETVKWMGKCPNCNEWNSLEENTIEIKKSSNNSRSTAKKKTIKKLAEVTSSNSDRIITNIGEFNRVMGGGIVKDSITIITAKPGAGKSTLLLQVADDVSSKGFKVIYASGEESDSQIKSRADRILNKINENIWIISDTNLDNVVDSIKEIDPDLMIVDSIQAFVLEDYLPSRAGSPTQTMECANELLRIAKNNERPRAVILVGQMNKNEEIAGLRSLEHLVDTVLIIDGENEEELRSLQSSKNRFGGTGETGFFSMTENGMVSIDNPSEFFMTKREEGDVISGSALTVVREGSRPIILEIESLVSNSFTPFPSRIGENLGKDQLNTLISILEQRGGFNLFNKNVVIKITGGLRIREQAINLAVIMCIVSSVYNKGIPNDIVFIADVGLTGELKKVPSLETRIKELDRMGFKKVYVAKNAFSRTVKFSNIQVVELKTLIEVINHVFGKLK
ncbi:MAG: DNA repair protein RadA [Sedimentibacter sp.]|uniref:DNA repair protein RadA n=1 Tax=Sedimentibacter sp. TaxID=1960295 RepID=UPI0029827623|nr:DNA repair protein RadA [Sedimentibacter sp.]MDW5298541.1 DNA repair protein RadA [Sedimentibacter sp.]